MNLNLDAIRAREAAATPGPWQWYGNTDFHNIYLSSTRYGRQIVMDFLRWGMNSAQPAFVEGREWKPDPQSWDDITACGTLTKAAELARYEVAPGATSRTDPAVYRADLRGVRNPDAEFIASARQDVSDLLAEVDRLRAQLDKACGSCHPCTNWADETWHRAGRKPPTVEAYDELRAELAETRTQRDAAKTIANELRDNLAAADEISANLQQHITAIRAEATA